MPNLRREGSIPKTVFPAPTGFLVTLIAFARCDGLGGRASSAPGLLASAGIVGWQLVSRRDPRSKNGRQVRFALTEPIKSTTP